MGAWVSTNYAVLACTGFPDCNGQWWPAWNFQGFEIWRGLGMDSKGQYLPMEALVSIHFVHRLMALFVFSFAAIMLWQFKKADILSGLTRVLFALLTLQLITGLSNVVLDWPLLAAVAVCTSGLEASIAAPDHRQIPSPTHLGCCYFPDAANCNGRMG